MPPFTDTELRNIQGFGLAGFRKDQQEVLFIRFGDQAGGRALLGWLCPQVANAFEVGGFNRVFSEIRARTGREDTVEATWTAVMVGAAGLDVLGAAPAGAPSTEGSVAFAAGMAARATKTGDTRPTDAPAGWLPAFRERGGVHLAVVVASDNLDDLDRNVQAVAEQASAHGAQVVWQERGATLPGPMRGHEHFGFRDGGSQPAVDGYDDPPAPGEPAAVPPGEVVLGYPDATGTAPTTDPLLVDGSMVVFRRLTQDVPAFRAQAAAGVPGAQPPVPPELLAAKLVGRWPSGAPLSQWPDTDPGPGHETNDFAYKASDDTGLACPRWSHIRKVNPRDETTPDPAGDAPALHRMLRRGIPFGPPYDPGTTAATERGLHFFAVVVDVARQFEFVQRQWLDNPNFPGGTPVPGGYGPPPQGAPDGPDPVVGRHDDGAALSYQQTGGARPTPVGPAPVRVTAGEYFLLPSLSALAALATATSPA